MKMSTFNARTALACVMLAALGLLAMHRPTPRVCCSATGAPCSTRTSTSESQAPTSTSTAAPINQAMRERGHAWDPSILTEPEHQCIPHPSTYGIRGVGTLRIWEDLDPVTQKQTEIETYIVWEAQHRHIYMDGRPHPVAASPHTWQGFSLGRWEGDQLVVHTDHLKVGWIRRNGLALSDRASSDERFIRHGDVLTHVLMVYDPVYLAEPMIKTTGYRQG